MHYIEKLCFESVMIGVSGFQATLFFDPSTAVVEMLQSRYSGIDFP